MDQLTMFFLFGAALAVIGLGLIELGISRKGKNILKLIGFGLCAYVVLSWAGVSLVQESAPPQTSVRATFDVTGSEAHSYMTVDNLAQKFVWTVYYNSTTSMIVGATQATLSFSIDRGIGTIGLVQTYAEVEYVPSVTNSTSGLSYSVITKSNDQYNAIWTRADSTNSYERITLTIAEGADGTTVALNLTLNAAAIGSMDQYDTAEVRLEVGGEIWAVQVMLVDNSI